MIHLAGDIVIESAVGNILLNEDAKVLSIVLDYFKFSFLCFCDAVPLSS